MNFQQILEFCKAKALHDALVPSEDSVWRSLCRTYSKKFFTPLHEVEALGVEYVVSHVFEDQFEMIDPIERVEDLLDQIYTLEDPEYKRQKEEDMEAFIKVAEEKERIRMEGLKVKPPKDAPKSGSVDFSHLKDEN